METAREKAITLLGRFGRQSQPLDESAARSSTP